MDFRFLEINLDEELLSFLKMHDFSAADGFLDITENLADMIRFAANEPSVGLFYIQQHTQNATPNVLSLKSKVSEKSHESSLHTQDLEDSMDMLRSMKECGPTTTDEMIKDIKRCLSIVQPKRVLSRGGGSSWSPATWGKNSLFTRPDDERSPPGYLSNIFRPAKWDSPRVFHEGEESSGVEVLVDLDPLRSFSMAQEGEAEDFPLSSELKEESGLDESLANQRLLLLYEKYDEFKADRVAKLEKWLGETGDGSTHVVKSGR